MEENKLHSSQTLRRKVTFGAGNVLSLGQFFMFHEPAARR